MLAKATATATYAENADYAAVKIRVENGQKPHPLSCSTRGKVAGFSRKSRKRLFDLLASIPHDVLQPGVLFVTLTYPSEFPTDHQTYKSHLRAFFKRLYRKIGREVPILWRLEFQKRGAPHFHLVVFGLRRVDLKWLSASWYEIVDSGDTSHLLAGTNVKFVLDKRAILWYVSKYMAKEMISMVGITGRVWGIWKRDLLDIRLITVEITVKSALAVREMMLGFLAGKGVDIERFTAYGIRSMTCYGFPLKSVVEGET
jgi:hypothetical protein